jgi:hypothetical protein
MTERTNQKDSGAQGTEQDDSWGSWRKIAEFFRGNPTLVLSLLYLYATAIGMAYSVRVYSAFGLNIFDYSEITDSLLAAFKNAFVLPLIGLQILLVVAMAISDFLLERVLSRRGYSSVPGTGMRPGTGPLAITAVGLMVAIAVPFLLGTYTARSIKHGKKPKVDVRYRSFSGSAGQVTEPGLELIGTTQKVVFFYDVKNKRTLVIPQGQIVSMEVPEPDRLRLDL